MICSYTEMRWELLVRAVQSAGRQTVRPGQIIVVIDHCPGLLRRARLALAECAAIDDRRQLTIVANSGQRGLSDARNTGLRSARRSVVAFLDDDAVADMKWLERLCEHYRDPIVVGVGGRVAPVWEARRPAWFPPEFDWVVGCSYRGLPERPRVIRNLVGANMSFRREALAEVGGFRPDLGRIGSVPLGCEETELCIRMGGSSGRVLLYDPGAVVHHQVPPARTTWSYFRSRCYAEGLSKATVRRLAGAGPALACERSYLCRIIPGGFVAALARGLRGRPTRAAGALAIVAGVVATVCGYVVGRSRPVVSDSGVSTRPAVGDAATRPRSGFGATEGASVARVFGRRRASPDLTVIRRTAGWAGAGALPMALVLWWRTLGHVDLSRMSDLGLVSVLPATFWAALVVLTAGFVVTVVRNRPSGASPLAYLAVLIAIMHGTPALLYGTLRYSWAWKHVGVVDYIVRHGSTGPKLSHDLAAYQSWPGFFALNALIVKVAGFHSALSYASWFPVLFNLLTVGPLLLIFRRFTSDRRLVWTAMWFFYLGSWVGQDYFSPQAYAYFLYLVVVAVCLRWYSSSGVGLAQLGGSAKMARTEPVRPLRVQPAKRAGILLMLVPLLAAIATSHQLTPFMLIAALTALVLFRRCFERLLPLVMIGLTLGWIVYAGRSYLSSNLDSIAASIGNPDANTKANLVNLSHVSQGQALVAQADRLLSAGLWVIAVLGGWRRRQLRQVDLPLMLLAVSPLPLVVANSYGGEMVFRVYLFALPFVAFFAAASVFPSPQAGRSRVSISALAILSVALLAAFTLSYYGKERTNYLSHDEVAASTWIYANAPRGSMVVGATNNLPWAFKNVERYQTYWFGLDVAEGRRKVLADPVGVLSAILRDPRYPGSYLILTRSQAAQVDATGLMPAGSVTRIERAVVGSGRFRVAFHNNDADVLVAVHSRGAS